MLLVHSKRGCIVPIALFVAIGLGGAAGRALGLQYGDSDRHWPVRVAVLTAAVLLLGLGARWRRTKGMLVWDARHERLTYLPAGHTFFWLDVQVWGWIVIGLWIYALFFDF